VHNRAPFSHDWRYLFRRNGRTWIHWSNEFDEIPGFEVAYYSGGSSLASVTFPTVFGILIPNHPLSRWCGWCGHSHVCSSWAANRAVVECVGPSCPGALNEQCLEEVNSIVLISHFRTHFQRFARPEICRARSVRVFMKNASQLDSRCAVIDSGFA
jgi:hypothetical protein